MTIKFRRFFHCNTAMFARNRTLVDRGFQVYLIKFLVYFIVLMIFLIEMIEVLGNFFKGRTMNYKRFKKIKFK